MDGEANKRQIGGDHYQTAIQHWDYVAANRLDYFQGQITKYVSRHKAKGKAADLEKALHFLQKYLEVEYGRKWSMNLMEEPLKPSLVLRTGMVQRLGMWAGPTGHHTCGDCGAIVPNAKVATHDCGPDRGGH